MIVHFLHIGKTGGTAIRHALLPALHAARHQIVLHDHSTTLADVPLGERSVFFLRDPISRFISGFYSRQRQGLPRYHSPWSDDERLAFERFQTPNQLAVALSAEDKSQRQLALDAMHSIEHVKSSYGNWLGDEEYIRSRMADLFFVGFQESLEIDFERLRQKLALPATLRLPTDDLHAHRNPPGLDTKLEEVAKQNLQLWYAVDFALLDVCRFAASDISQAIASDDPPCGATSQQLDITA